MNIEQRVESHNVGLEQKKINENKPPWVKRVCSYISSSMMDKYSNMSRKFLNWYEANHGLLSYSAILYKT